MHISYLGCIYIIPGLALAIIMVRYQVRYQPLALKQSPKKNTKQMERTFILTQAKRAQDMGEWKICVFHMNKIKLIQCYFRHCWLLTLHFKIYSSWLKLHTTFTRYMQVTIGQYNKHQTDEYERAKERTKVCLL